MEREMKNTKRILGALLLAVALASCGGSSSSNPSDTSVVVSADFNDDDVMFAQMMIPHHEQAIEMSDIALDPTVMAADVVKNLALKIKAAQDPEIQQMTGFLSLWNKSLTMDESMDHSDMMSGMLSAEELSRLSTLRGVDFDRAWLTGMIAHHEGAVEMAEAVLKDGVNTAVRELADAIIKGQEAEIAEMRNLIK
jgi:uncharacterized protein (DUF305 family)